MLTIDHPTEFVGYCEETGQLRCGILTPLIDLKDLPLSGRRIEDLIVIESPDGQGMQFRISLALSAALQKKAQFWIGNLDGSEEAWLIDLK